MCTEGLAAFVSGSLIYIPCCSNHREGYKYNYFVPSILFLSYLIHNSINSGSGEMKLSLLSDGAEELWFFVSGVNILICDNAR
jgi:hypothetical protein